MLKEKGYQFDVAFTSVLKRAINTLNIVLDEMNMSWIPVHKSWRLNERMYLVIFVFHFIYFFDIVEVWWLARIKQG